MATNAENFVKIGLVLSEITWLELVLKTGSSFGSYGQDLCFLVFSSLAIIIIIIRLHHSTKHQCLMWPIATELRGLSVGRLDTLMIPSVNRSRCCDSQGSVLNVGLDRNMGRVLLRSTYYDMPSGPYAQCDSQGGSTVIMTTCY